MPKSYFQINRIASEHNEAICSIIRSVGAEFGAIGDGFGPSDAEVAQMSAHYSARAGYQYLVALVGSTVVGGAGIAPFDEGQKICELRKMFLLRDYRGRGIGKALLGANLDFARQAGYQRCYLDTLATMTSAIALYAQFGFTCLAQPLTGTIHGGCDTWMMKDLTAP